MTRGSPDSSEPSALESESGNPRPFQRSSALVLLVLGTIAVFPGVASAHGGEHTPPIPQWYGLVVLLLGFGIAGATIAFKRYDRLERTEHALAGVFLGVIIAAAGGIMIVQLSPIDEYSASSNPSPWFRYPIVALTIGFTIVIGSALLGQFR